MPPYQRRVKVPGKTAQELYDKISSDIDHFLSKTSLGNFTLKRFPEKQEIQLQSSMLSAMLKCTEGAISLEGQLSFLASPFKAKIDQGIDKWIDQSFKSQA